jgi:hypothetical protein
LRSDRCEDYDLLRDMYADGLSRSDIVQLLGTTKMPQTLSMYIRSLESKFGRLLGKDERNGGGKNDQNTDSDKEGGVELPHRGHT